MKNIFSPSVSFIKFLRLILNGVIIRILRTFYILYARSAHRIADIEKYRALVSYVSSIDAYILFQVYIYLQQ